MAKRDRILAGVFANPVRANILWSDVVSMRKGFGAEISEGGGSRVRVHLNGVVAVFHRPHPQKETKRYAIRALRDFLSSAGVRP